MKVKSWVPDFLGVSMDRVVVVEGVRSSPVSSVWPGEVSIGASWSVFGQRALSPGLASVVVDGVRLLVGASR